MIWEFMSVVQVNIFCGGLTWGKSRTNQAGRTLIGKLPVQAPAAAQYIMHDNPAECTAAWFTRNRLTSVYIKRCPVGAGPQHRLDTRLSLDAWDGELSDWERRPCDSSVAGNLPINLRVIIKAWIVKASSGWLLYMYAHPFALSWDGMM